MSKILITCLIVLGWAQFASAQQATILDPNQFTPHSAGFLTACSQLSLYAQAVDNLEINHIHMQRHIRLLEKTTPKEGESITIRHADNLLMSAIESLKIKLQNHGNLHGCWRTTYPQELEE